jgi:hypothetical protein
MNAYQQDITYEKNIKNIFSKYVNKEDLDYDYDVYNVYKTKKLNLSCDFILKSTLNSAYIWDLTLEIDLDIDIDLISLINDLVIYVKIGDSIINDFNMKYNLYFASLFKRKIIINNDKYLIPLVGLDILKLKKFPLFLLNYHVVEVTLATHQRTLQKLQNKCCLSFKYCNKEKEKLLNKSLMVLTYTSAEIAYFDLENKQYCCLKNLISKLTKFLFFEFISNKEELEEVILDQLIVKDNNKNVIIFDISLGDICIIKILNKKMYAIQVDYELFKDKTIYMTFLLNSNKNYSVMITHVSSNYLNMMSGMAGLRYSY